MPHNSITPIIPDPRPLLAWWRLCEAARDLSRAIDKELRQYKNAELAAMQRDVERFEYAFRLMLKAGYNPDQPRVPAGSSDGGQWTGSGGGGSAENFKPVYDGDPDEPIEPVYPIEEGIGFLVGGAGFGALRQGLWRGATEVSWTLGTHKSPTKWANQMRARGWTPEKISDTIKNGKKYSAPNDVRKRIDPKTTATRYEKDGKFVVRDDQTGEILQISAPGNFIPKQLN